MPARSRKVPSYRLHKPTGQAVVRLDGRDHYLGKFDTPASREKYHRLVAEWLAAGSLPRPAADPGAPAVAVAVTVDELVLAYWRHAESYYRLPDGTPSSELSNVRLALRVLRKIYGGTPAAEFGPKALKAVRQDMVAAGLGRRTVNQRVARVVRAFRFAVEHELVSPAVLQALKAVPGLRAGRSGAKESRAVAPVADADVDAVLPHLTPPLRAAVELLRLTGARSGEVLSLRTGDVERDGPVWWYTPARHKTQHRGKARRVPLGPKAQEVLTPWLRADPAEYVFRPKDGQEAFLAERRRRRVTPLTPSQRARRRKAAPAKAPGERYDTRTLNHAVARGCERAGVARWHPHQLRHAAATRLRKEFGLDAARAVLGHGGLAVTEVYAEVDAAKAEAAMARVG